MENSFEVAVDGVASGDVAGLHSLLVEMPSLATARSSRAHQATLLHYIAANGVENERQKTPENAPSVVEALVAAGTEVNALSQIYGGGPASTPLHLTVTSAHPAQAGNQAQIVATLCEAGASVNGVDNKGGPVRGVLAFMYPPGGFYESQYIAARTTLNVLIERGAQIDDIFAAIVLRRLDQFQRSLEEVLASKTARLRAFSLACLSGQQEIATLLLEGKVDINGSYAQNETGLHLAAATDEIGMVKFLVDHGADVTRRDDRYGLIPLEWAVRFDRGEVRAYLEQAA
tara:strand:- start:1519 stop:2379 length:861 start_codon:yes stop_codon:yes gene_type:complete